MNGSGFNNSKVSEKLSVFISKKAKILIAVLAVIVIGVTSFSIFSCVKNKKKVEGLEAIAKVEKDIFNSSSLSEEEKSKQQDEALLKLEKYTSLKGVVGVRANMLSAEIAKLQKNLESAASYYIAAADRDSSAYTYEICCFNAAVCYENAGNIEKSLEYYGKVSSNDSNMLKSHAMFSVGRIYETQGKIDEAVESYSALYNSMKDNIRDEWVFLAKSRLLALGK